MMMMTKVNGIKVFVKVYEVNLDLNTIKELSNRIGVSFISTSKTKPNYEIFYLDPNASRSKCIISVMCCHCLIYFITKPPPTRERARKLCSLLPLCALFRLTFKCAAQCTLCINSFLILCVLLMQFSNNEF